MGYLSVLLGVALFFANATVKANARRISPDLFIRNFMSESELKSGVADPGVTREKQLSETSMLLSKIGHPNSQDSADLENGALSNVGMSDFMKALRQFGLVDVAYEGGPVSKFMVDLYRKLEEGDALPKAAGHKNVDVAVLKADTIRGLPATEMREKQRVTILTFNLSNFDREEVTKRVELRLRLREKHDRDLKFRAKVKVLRQGVVVDEMKYSVRPQYEQASDNAILDLTPMLQKVIDGGHRDTTIQIKLRKKNKKQTRANRDRRSFSHSDEDVENSQAILVVFTKDKNFFEKFSRQHAGINTPIPEGQSQEHTIRHRRASDRNNKKTNKKQGSKRDICSKSDLMIDFDQAGWGQWIIYPKRYNAFQCHGRCPSPVPSSFDPTNHAILQSILRIADKAVPRPCCVPTKLKPLSMLYFESNEIVVRHHKDMIVDECGCR